MACGCGWDVPQFSAVECIVAAFRTFRVVLRPSGRCVAVAAVDDWLRLCRQCVYLSLTASPQSLVHGQTLCVCRVCDQMVRVLCGLRLSWISATVLRL